MGSVTVQVKGLAEINQRLSQLGPKVERTVVRKALAAGAAVIRDEARLRAPVYTGNVSEGHPPPGTLKKSIWQKYIPEASRSGRTVFFVGVRHGKGRQSVGKKSLNLDAYYWWFVEFGSRNNRPARPFMRPAYEAKKGAAVDAIADVLSSGIAQAAKS